MQENLVLKISKPKISNERTRFLSDEERTRLIKVCQESESKGLYPIVILALSTGMRRGEILNLKWSDIDLDRGAILLQTTKNGERRFVPLVGMALDLLKSRHASPPTNSLVFPAPHPESLFNTIRTWAILQYSEYLQIHNRLEEASDFLKSQINELWFSRSRKNDKTAVQLELKLLEKQIRTGDLIGSKYESRIKQWIAVLIGIPFFVSMMGGILAGNHLQYTELVRLVIVIALSTVLIMGIVLLSLGCDKKQKRSILYTVALIALTLFIFIAPGFSKKSSQLTPPLTEEVSKSSEIQSETQTTKIENSLTDLTGQSS